MHPHVYVWDVCGSVGPCLCACPLVECALVPLVECPLNVQVLVDEAGERPRGAAVEAISTFVDTLLLVRDVQVTLDSTCVGAAPPAGSDSTPPSAAAPGTAPSTSNAPQSDERPLVRCGISSTATCSWNHAVLSCYIRVKTGRRFTCLRTSWMHLRLSPLCILCFSVAFPLCLCVRVRLSVCMCVCMLTTSIGILSPLPASGSHSPSNNQQSYSCIPAHSTQTEACSKMPIQGGQDSHTPNSATGGPSAPPARPKSRMQVDSCCMCLLDL